MALYKASGSEQIECSNKIDTYMSELRLKNTKAYEHRLYELVNDAIERRIRAVSGDIGGGLSGGLDSSVIAALISKFDRNSIFFSWSRSPDEQPLNQGEDERKTIQDLCNMHHITCYYHSEKTAYDIWEYTSKFDKRLPPFLNTTKIMEGALFLKNLGVIYKVT